MSSQDSAEAALQAEFATYVSTIAAGFAKPLQASLEDAEREMGARIKKQRDAAAQADLEAKQQLAALASSAMEQASRLSSIIQQSATELARSQRTFENKLRAELQDILQGELVRVRGEINILDASVRSGQDATDRGQGEIIGHHQALAADLKGLQDTSNRKKEESRERDQALGTSVRSLRVFLYVVLAIQLISIVGLALLYLRVRPS